MNCPFVIKICSVCKEMLVAYNGNFGKEKGGKYGLRSRCKRCRKIERKEYYEENKEKIKEYHKKHYEENKELYKEYREENKEKIKEYHREYYEENKEYYKGYYEENKEKIKKRYKKWYKNNPEKQFNKYAKRRQLEESQGRGITKEQWLEMMNFFDWKCAYSGIQLNKDNRSIDHIVALSNKGKHEAWNCIPMYMPYNSSKNINNMIDWYIQQPFFSEERLNKIYEWIEYAKNKWENSNK